MFTVPTPRNVNEAAFQARVQSRANVLFTSDGYRYEKVDGPQAGMYYRVHSPEGKTYIVDPLLERCDCECNTRNGFCKHSLAIGEVMHWEAQCSEHDRMAQDAECANGTDYLL